MYELQRNSRGEWCACVEHEETGYGTVHHLRTLVPIPGTDPDSTGELALEQLKRNYELIKGSTWTN